MDVSSPFQGFVLFPGKINPSARHQDCNYSSRYLNIKIFSVQSKTICFN
jgi:hypothetical protein